MSLIKGTLFIRDRFEKGSRPSLAKLYQWIDSGDVPGVILNGTAYVDITQFDLKCATPKAQQLRDEVILSLLM